MKKIFFIVNPKSEDIDRPLLESVISRFSEKYKFNWDIYYTGKSDGTDIIKLKFQEYDPDILVAAGGDGTINQVASGIINTRTELGIIPAGSANGLAFNLDIPADIEKALEIILNNNAKPIDVILLNNKIYCFHLSDIGINARIVKRFDKEGSKGLAGYGKQMFKELFSKRTSFRFALETPVESERYKAEMLVIANARSFGTGAVINPAGELDDGKFEIVIIRPYPWWGLFYLVRMFLFGKLENIKYVKLIQTNKAKIRFDKSHDLQTDGEIITGINSLELDILPSALKVRYSQSDNNPDN